MTDTELNEKIALLMGGWKQVDGGGWVHNDKFYYKALPDFLDPKRLSELLRLAATMGRWELCVEPQGDFFAQIELPSDDDDDDLHATGKGFTEPLAVARAIVAHSEHETRRKVVEDLKKVTQEPVDPPPLKLGVNMTGWNSCPHCGRKSKVGA